jgi:hypothetical protein
MGRYISGVDHPGFKSCQETSDNSMCASPRNRCRTTDPIE